MGRNLTYFLTGTLVYASLLATPYTSYAGSMTGSGGTRYENKNPSERNEKREKILKKMTEKAFDRINPVPSPLMKGIEKFSEKYKEFREKTGNNVTGTGRTTGE